MNLFRARVRESNVVGNNFGIERDSTYQDPIAIKASPASTYRPGDEVLCAELEDGTSVIVGSIPGEFRRAGGAYREKVSGKELELSATPESKLVLDSRFSRVGEFSSSGVELPDLLPGDNKLSSSSGNSIKALGGGINIMDSGRARVTTNASTGSVEVDCETFTLTSGMGGLSIAPDESGGFSLSFKGSRNPAQSNKNANPGASPDFSASFKIGEEVSATTSSGFGIRVDPDGTIVLNGTSVYVQTEDSLVPLYEPSFQDKKEIFADNTELVGNNLLSMSSEGNREDSTAGDKLESVGKQFLLSVTGPASTSNPDIIANPANVYSKEEQIVNGGSKVTVGTPATGGGKYKVSSYGDIHLSSASSNRGGAAVVIDPAGTPNAPVHGLWGYVSTAKASLHTSLLASTPDSVGDGLPNPWVAVPPLAGGLNPLCTGYVKYSQYSTSWLPALTAMQAAFTALAAEPTLTGSKVATGAAAAALAVKLIALPTEETKTSYINEAL